MKAVPQARQPSAPGARFVSGRLLNKICEAIIARTPLNAQQAEPKGHQGATDKGGVAPKGPEVKAKYDPARTYVLPPATVQRWAGALRVRMPADELMRAAPVGATATGLESLLRRVLEATPKAYTSATPEGYQLPVTGGRLAGLQVEIERKAVVADLCSLAWRAEEQVYVEKQITETIYEEGTGTETLFAGGNIRTWLPGETPTACDLPAYEYDPPELPWDLGAFISSSESEVTRPFSEVQAAALSALAAATATPDTETFAWPENAWRETSAAGGWSFSLGIIGCSPSAAASGIADPSTFRWRVKNTGQCHAKVFWERRREDDDTLLASGSVSLGRGQTSDWQAPPTTPMDATDRFRVTLSGVHLGPYR